MRFLDNVLQDYIDRHEPGMSVPPIPPAASGRSASA